eukprot:m.169474 g.169474  ORF g.169474 m.169474 type:complete len:346 (+) comp31573_c0_seq2:158-1195(+)
MGLMPASVLSTGVRIIIAWGIVFFVEPNTLSHWFFNLVTGYTTLLVLAKIIQWSGTKSLGDVSPKSGRFALVTGASLGIGSAIAEELGERGYDLVLVSYNQKRLEERQSQLRKNFPNITVLAIQCDLSRSGAAQVVVEELFNLGVEDVSLLCNNAGSALWKEFALTSVDDLERTMSLNTRSYVQLCRALLPPMLKRGAGRILNVSSISGEAPANNLAIYNATKAFVSQFSFSLAHELKGTGVSITCSLPGATDTKFAEHAGVTEAVCFNVPLCHHSAVDVAKVSVAAMLQGVDVAPPPGLMNRFYVDVAVPFLPQVLTTSLASLMWGPMSNVPGLATLVGATKQK